MDLSFEPLQLHLRVPFTISRGTQLVADNVLVTLREGELSGIGEAAPSEHYGELQGTVLAFLDHFRTLLREAQHAADLQSHGAFPGSAPALLPITTLHALLDEVAHLNPAAKAAVDIAAYDLLGQRLGAPLSTLLGLDPSRTPQTSFTIGIDTPEVMARKATEAREYPILKVKVGTPHDVANLTAIRAARPDAVIRVDANAAWTPKEAVERIQALAPFDLQFVEQPVADRDLAGLDHVRRSVNLPVIADESCIVPADVPRVAPYVDGINIKLMKCGGIYPALQMIHLARAHHLRVMMGCMIESSVAITAAAQLSPLIDYADLDGNLLIADDPFQGVTVQDGKLILPNRPGLGVRPSQALMAGSGPRPPLSDLRQHGG